jgi:hypothetical protein
MRQGGTCGCHLPPIHPTLQVKHWSSVSKVPPTGSRAEYQTLLQRRGVVDAMCEGNDNLASSHAGTSGGVWGL